MWCGIRRSARLWGSDAVLRDGRSFWLLYLLPSRNRDQVRERNLLGHGYTRNGAPTVTRMLLSQCAFVNLLYRNFRYNFGEFMARSWRVHGVCYRLMRTCTRRHSFGLATASSNVCTRATLALCRCSQFQTTQDILRSVFTGQQEGAHSTFTFGARPLISLTIDIPIGSWLHAACCTLRFTSSLIAMC